MVSSTLIYCTFVTISVAGTSILLKDLHLPEIDLKTKQRREETGFLHMRKQRC